MNKKAFTLAEVLITLSILGVVAALTIPSLVNRQSDLAAQTKLKKAISQYETMASVYMAENEAASMAFSACSELEGYFKQVDGAGTCKFTTADGAYWVFQETSGKGNGNAVVYDAKDSPRYGVVLWNANNRVNAEGTADGDVSNFPTGGIFLNGGGQGEQLKLANERKLSTANYFMNGKLNCAADPVVSDNKITCQ